MAVPKDQQAASKLAEALGYFAKLAQLEESFAQLTAEERYIKRLKQEKPTLEALLAWANSLKSKSALGKDNETETPWIFSGQLRDQFCGWRNEPARV